MPSRYCYRPMATLVPSRLRILLAICIALLQAAPAVAEIHPYSALYSLSRNGKLIGKVEVSLQPENGGWAIKSELRGTHGLAKLLRARDTEHVSGQLLEGRFLPENYTRHTRVASIDDRWFANFDWDAGQVSVIHDKDDPIVMDLVGESLDPLSLKLEMRRRLSLPEPDLRFHMVEEDEIDEQNFRILRSEWLETSLGCLETVPVEKIRFNSKRYTRAWHAPELAYIEVRMEHGKTGGDHLEMRITELALGDLKITPRPGCSSKQRMSSPESISEDK